MKDQIISLDTAKLAHKKGFWWFHAPLPSLIFEHKYLPTQSLLQKWLREKHNLYPSYTGNEHFSSFSFLKPKIDIKSYIRDTDNHYEKALEIWLQEALKLIEK